MLMSALTCLARGTRCGDVLIPYNRSVPNSTEMVVGAAIEVVYATRGLLVAATVTAGSGGRFTAGSASVLPKARMIKVHTTEC